MKRSARNTTLQIGTVVLAAAFALPVVAQTAGVASGTPGSASSPSMGGTPAPGAADSGMSSGPMGGSAIGSGPRDARDVGTPPRDARDINGTGVDMRSRSGSTGSTVGDSGAMGSNPQDARDINGSATGSAGGIGGPGSAERELEDDPYSGTTGATGTMNRRSGVESPLERQDRIRSEQRRREMERQGGRLPGATPPEGSIYR